jgi:hypothetical protein
LGDWIDAGDGLVDVVEEEVVYGGVPGIGGEDVDVLIGRGEGRDVGNVRHCHRKHTPSSSRSVAGWQMRGRTGG